MLPRLAAVIIFGTAPFHKVLGVMMALCGRCHNQAAHHILKRGTKFSLFFIPLFPISSYYALECSVCGQQRRLTRQEAESLAAGQGEGAQAPHTPDQRWQSQPQQPWQGQQGQQPWQGQQGQQPWQSQEGNGQQGPHNPWGRQG